MSVQFYKGLTHSRDSVSAMSYKQVGRKIGDVRKAVKSFESMVDLEFELHGIHEGLRQGLLEAGTATDYMKETKDTLYIEGQRAEMRWLFKGKVVLGKLQKMALLSDEMLVFSMSFLIGWQLADYQRSVERTQSPTRFRR